jgi:hypothetical protein
VYFRCNGDNKTNLLDVKEANSMYNFKGEESWQVSQVIFSKWVNFVYVFAFKRGFTTVMS